MVFRKYNPKKKIRGAKYSKQMVWSETLNANVVVSRGLGAYNLTSQ